MISLSGVKHLSRDEYCKVLRFTELASEKGMASSATVASKTKRNLRKFIERATLEYLSKLTGDELVAVAQSTDAQQQMQNFIKQVSSFQHVQLTGKEFITAAQSVNANMEFIFDLNVDGKIRVKVNSIPVRTGFSKRFYILEHFVIDKSLLFK